MVLLQIYGVIRIGKISQFKPVSTIPVVGEYQCYWYAPGNSNLLFIIEEIVSTFGDRGAYVGEQDAEELEECLLNPETRNIVQLMVDDLKETEKLLDIFMGPSPALRRDYILQHELKGGE